MKKLTWLLMSLMLFLGMGTAFAQTLPDPTFTPNGNNVSAAPGQTITFTKPSLDFNDYTMGMVVLCYGFDVSSQLKPTTDELTSIMTYIQSNGEAGSKPAAYEVIGLDEEGWSGSVVIPTDASGMVEFKARYAALGEDEDGMAVAIYSELVDASYIVQGEVAKPAKPTFNPATGEEIEAGSTVAISAETEEIWYCINCEDADLTLTGYMSGKCEAYDSPIKMMQDATIKAVAVGGNYPDFILSDVATATYTVTGGEDMFPTLTVTPSESPVMVPGTTTFSCTMDPKQYTHASSKVGFVISIENVANIATLEFQVGETMDPEGTWTAYDKTKIVGLQPDAYIAAIPDQNGNPNNNKAIAIAATTVHYRMTLNDATSAKITFSVLECNAYGNVSNTSDVLTTATPLAFQSSVKIKPAAPIFEPEAGEVPFGTNVMLACETNGVTIHFTTDGTVPTAESEAYTWMTDILVTEPMTVKAIAILDGEASDVAEAAYTVAPLNATVVLSPMKDGMVGKNVSTALTIKDPENAESEDWMQAFPAFVYYTTDGETVPSKAAYEAQTDKENGAIKMLAVKWEDQYGWYGPVADNEGNLMSLTFTEPTHLKAIGYLMDGDNVLITTDLFDQELGIESGINPTFSIANYTKVAVGDKLVIENPNPYPAEPDIEMPEDWDDEEGWAAYDAAWEEYEAAIAEIPATEMYFSFDGTKPTRLAQLDDENESVFVTKTGQNVEITFGEDEDGLYAYVPEILGYNSPADYIRLEADGKFMVQVLAITSVTESEEGGDPMPLNAKWGRPGGAQSFSYGSDFVTRHYTMNEEFPAVEVTFNPASGSEVDENTAVTITANRDVDIFYMMFESEEAAKAAEWDIEAAELYGEMKPVLSPEKNTVKVAYANEGADAVEETFFYATYTVKALPAIELTFNPAPGSEVEEGTAITVTASRQTEIFYNLYADKAAADADDAFMANAKEIAEDGKPVITKENTFLRCAVYDKGEMKYFDAAYTVKPGETEANEDLELAGVSVYPNPSNGMFNLELPVAATVEVFASNGMLTQRFTANAGNATLNINRSGIYFLRITGEGRTAIKRIIVR